MEKEQGCDLRKNEDSEKSWRKNTFRLQPFSIFIEEKGSKNLANLTFSEKFASYVLKYSLRYSFLSFPSFLTIHFIDGAIYRIVKLDKKLDLAKIKTYS